MSLAKINPDQNIKLDQTQIRFASGIAYTPDKSTIQHNYHHLYISVQETGKPVRLDANPVSRYNHCVRLFMSEQNQIQGVQLIQICLPCPVSWLYDTFIYFYITFLMAITCQFTEGTCGYLKTLLMLGIYFVLLFMPFISIITLAITSIFFLYYCAAIIVRTINLKRLGDKQYTHYMVPAHQAPPFSQDKNNAFFEINSQSTQSYFLQHNNIILYNQLLARRKTEFMAYRPTMLENHYYYIVSAKQIIFHIVALGISICGLIGSVNIFPLLYGLPPNPTA